MPHTDLNRISISMHLNGNDFKELELRSRQEGYHGVGHLAGKLVEEWLRHRRKQAKRFSKE